MVSDERALAIRLAATDDDALARTFAARGVTASRRRGTTSSTPPPALLDAASVERAIASFPAPR